MPRRHGPNLISLLRSGSGLTDNVPLLTTHNTAHNILQPLTFRAGTGFIR